MVATTLRVLIDQTADYVKADLDDDDDREIIEGRIISGLNEAKNEIAKKHYPLYFTEDIELDERGSFEVDSTTETFWKLIGAKRGDCVVDAEQRGAKVYCYLPQGTVVTITYQYIPKDMAHEDDEYPLPDAVDYRLLCYRAAQVFYEIKGTASSLNKSIVWKTKWSDAVRSRFAVNDAVPIRDVYKTRPVW